MFIVSLNYIKALDEVDQYIGAHIDYLKKYYEKKVFIVSGRKVPRSGGVILMNCADRKQVDSIIQEDPFFQARVAEYDVVEIVPTMVMSGFEKMLDFI